MNLRFLSVSSGIEAASVAWNRLGWEAVGFSEIEPFPCAVLRHHYPHVPNFGDMTQFETWPDANTLRPDLLCGGTPCQSFSVAGLRQGLDDPRGDLMLTFGAIAARYRPRWLVWENVPGVLSSNSGRDFATFLGLITGQAVEPPTEGWQNSGILSGIASAYGVAWRVLDAQHFGVPQRRRRVFVIGYLGDWRRAAAVLFERESLRRDPPPSRESGKTTTGTLTPSAVDGSSPCGGDGRDSFLIDVCPTVSSKWAKGSGGPSGDECQNLLAVSALDASYGRLQGCSGQDLNHGHSHLVTHALTGEGFDASEDGTGRGTPIVPVHTTGAGFWQEGFGTLRGREQDSHENLVAFDSKASGQNGFGIGEVSPTLRAMAHKASHSNAGGQVAIAFTQNQAGDVLTGEQMHSLATNGNATGRNAANVALGTAVRRLTPRECERLQDFPDDYTAIPWRGKPADQCPDGPRYKALGNSWATCVPRWIGERIQMVESEVSA